MIRLMTICTSLPNEKGTHEVQQAEPLPVQVVAVTADATEALRVLGSGMNPDLLLWDATGWPDELAERLRVHMASIPYLLICKGAERRMLGLSWDALVTWNSPPDHNALRMALAKYMKLKEHFRNGFSQGERDPRPHHPCRRIVGWRDGHYHVLTPDNIVLLTTENKTCLVRDASGSSYELEGTLSTWATLLDRSMFFRANRQYLINLRCIRSFRMVDKARICVELASQGETIEVMVSQENAASFRDWVAH